MNMDLIIAGGTIVDGTGGAPYRGDLAIRSGQIAEIAEIGVLDKVPGAAVLDVQGLVVTPGFIDIHSHSDYTLFADPRAVSSITQGVTLEVVGNCGHGCAPVGEPELVRSNIYGYQPEHGMPWRSVRQYLDALDQVEPAVNIAVLVPNGCLRLAVMGRAERPALPRELEDMKRLLQDALEAGACGYSTGLEYAPESHSSEQEVIELCRVCAKEGGLYATHTRNRPNEVHEAVAEPIRSAAESGARLQISHILSLSRLAESGRWALEQAIEQIEQANRQGIEVGFDMHTRLFGMTQLSNVLPQWAVEGTPSDTVARLGRSSLRKKMKEHRSIVNALAREDDWSRIVFFECPSRPEVSRKSVAEISQEWNLEPLDVMYDILRGEGENLHSLMVLGYAYEEKDQSYAFDHPDCMVGSDGTAMAPCAEIQSGLAHGAFNWAAWFIRRFVRETGKLTLQEAVRRITSLPAGQIGLTDRGVLRSGAWADIAIFDPNLFGERGTTFQPEQIAEGMKHVLVNGTLALKDGGLAPLRSGRVLRFSGRS